MPRRRSDDVDTIVGKNILLLRKHRGMSQTELAKKVGVSFQQVQKYENGSNRVGGGRLYRISAVLKVPVGSLFEGVVKSAEDKLESSPTAMLAVPHALRLLKAFSLLEDAAFRKSIVEMVESAPAKSRNDAGPSKR